MNRNCTLSLWLLAICCIVFPLFSGDTLYVSNHSGNSISVVDGDTNALIDTVATGSRPLMMAATSDGKKLYVSNSNSNSVYVIDTTTLVATPIAVGGSTQVLAISPDGSYLYVPATNPTNTVIQVIDISSDEIIDTIDTIDTGSAYSIGSISFTPDGRYAYMVSYSNDVVIALDTATNTIVNLIDVGKTPANIQIIPDGTKAYVTNMGDGTVSVIDVATNTVTKTIMEPIPNGDLQFVMSALSPDGSFLYVPLYADDEIAVIKTEGDMLVTKIAVGNNPQSILISSDGSYGYVSNGRDDNISVLDLQTNEEITAIIVGQYPAYPSFSSDTSRLYVTDANGNSLNVIDTSINEVIATVTVGSSPAFVLVVPEGVQPPESLQGNQRIDRFLTQTILRNTLTWQAPSTGPAVALYRIYADSALTELLGTVEGNAPLQFSFSVGEKKRSYTYYVVSVDGQGNESTSVSVQINP